MTLDSRLRGNDGSRSRCAGGTGLDCRVREIGPVVSQFAFRSLALLEYVPSLATRRLGRPFRVSVKQAPNEFH